MVNLLSYITADSLLSIDSDSHAEIQKHLLDRCLDGMPEQTRSALTRKLLGKRGLQEVNLGGGFALSHARLEELGDLRMSVGLLGRKIRYLKGPPVQTVFCVVLPNARSRYYLSLMARLTRLISHPEASEAFHSGDRQAILRTVRQFEKP